MSQVLKVSATEAFSRAEDHNASSAETGSALYWMRRIAREKAYDISFLNRYRDGATFTTSETAVLRGRKVEIRCFVGHGHIHSTRWSVDGHQWSADQVNQAFGF
jgi:hypothetical protein